MKTFNKWILSDIKIKKRMESEYMIKKNESINFPTTGYTKKKIIWLSAKMVLLFEKGIRQT